MEDPDKTSGPPLDKEAADDTTPLTAQPSYGAIPSNEDVVFGETPVWITDDKGNRVQTELRYKNGLFMWVVVLATFWILLAFYMCCFAFVPLFFKSLKDIEHINPRDGTVVGKLDRARFYGLRS